MSGGISSFFLAAMAVSTSAGFSPALMIFSAAPFAPAPIHSRPRCPAPVKSPVVTASLTRVPAGTGVAPSTKPFCDAHSLASWELLITVPVVMALLVGVLATALRKSPQSPFFIPSFAVRDIPADSGAVPRAKIERATSRATGATSNTSPMPAPFSSANPHRPSFILMM